jgi:malonyl-CoA O-methyltransferase
MSEAVRHRFERAAAGYDQAGGVQADVARRLAAGLPQGAAPRTILDVGCGTGNLTSELRARYPRARLWALDAAPAMLAAAQRRMADGAAREPVWINADVRAFEPPRAFDLIASSAALQWVRPLPATLARLASWLAPGGMLAMAVMVDGTLAELAASRRAVAPDKAGAWPLPSAEHVMESLSAAGLRLVAAEDRAWCERAASAAALLDSLRAQGVTGGPPPSLNRRQLADLTAHYDAAFAHDDGGVRVSWRVLSLQAEKRDGAMAR